MSDAKTTRKLQPWIRSRPVRICIHLSLHTIMVSRLIFSGQTARTFCRVLALYTSLNENSNIYIPSLFFHVWADKLPEWGEPRQPFRLSYEFQCCRAQFDFWNGTNKDGSIIHNAFSKIWLCLYLNSVRGACIPRQVVRLTQHTCICCACGRRDITIMRIQSSGKTPTDVLTYLDKALWLVSYTLTSLT